MNEYKATIAFKSGIIRDLFCVGESEQEIAMNIMNYGEIKTSKPELGLFAYYSDYVESVYVVKIGDHYEI